MNTVGRVLKAIREARCLSLPQLAQAIGYRNLQKGVRKLMIAEATGKIEDDVLVSVLEVVGVDPFTFDEMTETLYLTGVMPPLPAQKCQLSSLAETRVGNTGKQA